MKNTRKSNLKARLAAAAMALITMTSTTSLIVNSSLSQTSITVCAASDNMMNLDENIVGAGKVTFEVLMKVLEECTPYGKFAVPAINGIIGMVAGEEPDPVMEKLDEISDKIDRLFDKITESEKTVIGAMETALGSNNAYQSYVNFKNKVTYIKDTIKETVNDDEMSNVNKMAKIGSLIGNFYKWNNTFFDTFNNVNTYFKKSSAYGKNIFETIYDHNCLSSMFSGEAIDKSKEAFRSVPANSYIITDGAWGDSSFKLVKEEGWAYFKGINIDDKSGSEKNVKFWSVGWKGQELPIVGFVGDKWNKAESGSACRFQTI